MKHISHDPNTMLFTVILNETKGLIEGTEKLIFMSIPFIRFLKPYNNKTKDSPFDLERCGPAIDLAIEVINHRYLKQHKISLQKRTER